MRPAEAGLSLLLLSSGSKEGSQPRPPALEQVPDVRPPGGVWPLARVPLGFSSASHRGPAATTMFGEHLQ